MIIDNDRKLVIHDGVRLRLTSTQFDLVSYLAAHPEYVRSREQILIATRGYASSFEASPRVVDTEVKRTRRKFEKAFGYCPIKTMYCEGYYWQE